MQYGRSGVGHGVRSPPGPLSLGTRLCLNMCLLSFITLVLFTNTSSVCTSSCAEVEHVLLFWELSFSVSVLVNLPHASMALLSALSGPLSLGRSFSYV